MELIQTRRQRGHDIAKSTGVKRNRLGWRVPSQSHKGSYVVTVDDGLFCSCPDFESRGRRCKHIFAVEFVIYEEVNAEGGLTQTVRVTYQQNWPAYNAAQTHEKDRFQVLLQDLCAGLQEPPRTKRGRPPIPLSDAIFSATFKVYSTVSGRRFMSDLRSAHERGHINRLPSYNSIFNIMDSETTTAALDRLIIESALPLKAVESSFACDSSGFSASKFDRWFDHKHGKSKIQRVWVKAHIMTGVKTNVVTALEIRGRNANDAPLLPPLLTTTARGFDIDEVSADMGYTSERNLQAIVAAGATPYIPFKHNATPTRGGLWAKMYHYYNLRRDDFLSRYHLRSNVETTFAMIKAKFGDSIRSKTDTAMKNEVRAKILCHNICCVIQSMYELDVDPVFWASTQS